jgi:hypothetical protein
MTSFPFPNSNNSLVSRCYDHFGPLKLAMAIKDCERILLNRFLVCFRVHLQLQLFSVPMDIIP